MRQAPSRHDVQSVNIQHQCCNPSYCWKVLALIDSVCLADAAAAEKVTVCVTVLSAEAFVVAAGVSRF